MDRQEAGAKGGRETVKRHGREHMVEIGKRGFATTVARHWLGDKEAYKQFLSARNWNKLADTFAERELNRRLANGEQIASIELPVMDDGLDF